MFDDDILVSVANRGSVAKTVVQRTWNAVAVEVAEIAMSRNILSLYLIEKLRIHIVKLMDRMGRVYRLQEQRQWQCTVGPLGEVLLFDGSMRNTDTYIAEVVVETLRHYVVGRADVGQRMFEILVQPRGEEI
jgi:hypothetical protein